MKLLLLTESNYETFYIRVDRIIDDKATDSQKLMPYGQLSTQIARGSPNPQRQALRNVRYRVAKSLGISYDDVLRNYKTTIVKAGKPISSKLTAGKKHITCRACGQYNEASPLGDICTDCNKYDA